MIRLTTTQRVAARRYITDEQGVLDERITNLRVVSNSEVAIKIVMGRRKNLDLQGPISVKYEFLVRTRAD